MNKKIIISFGAAALLASSLFAFPAQSCPSPDDGGICHQGKNMPRKHDRHHDGIIPMMLHLNLNKEQRAQVREIFEKDRKNAPQVSMAFTDTSFNKAEYIKLVQERRANEIEHKAKIISAIYNILTPIQKQRFKAILFLKESMKGHKRMCPHHNR